MRRQGISSRLGSQSRSNQAIMTMALHHSWKSSLANGDCAVGGLCSPISLQPGFSRPISCPACFNCACQRNLLRDGHTSQWNTRSSRPREVQVTVGRTEKVRCDRSCKSTLRLHAIRSPIFTPWQFVAVHNKINAFSNDKWSSNDKENFLFGIVAIQPHFN